MTFGTMSKGLQNTIKALIEGGERSCNLQRQDLERRSDSKAEAQLGMVEGQPLHSMDSFLCSCSTSSSTCAGFKCFSGTCVQPGKIGVGDDAGDAT